MKPGLMLLLLALANNANAQDRRFQLKGELAAEARGFLHPPVDSRQAQPADVSLRLQPEFYVDWGKNTSMTFTPFARLDSEDDERSHADVRELFVRHRAGAFEGRIGLRKVYWGATESSHLVDIINQTDLVENLDTEDKLGQPMANLAWFSKFGTLDLFVLPYFRERTFPGVNGRLRPVQSSALPPRVSVDTQNANYQSSAEQQHVDWAARYAYSQGSLDLGLSHFSGTARAPRFDRPGSVVPTPAGIVLVPFYPQIEQTGLDATYVMGGWLLKLEGVYQHNSFEDYNAAAGGFEYTFTGIFGSALDAGVLLEYLWDERNGAIALPFQNDLFAGTRIAGNDVAGAELLAGAVIDLDTQASFLNLETSRRFGSHWKAVLEARLFENAPPNDPAFSFREDDYISLEIIRYF